MIRSITIIEITEEGKAPVYSANGSLPLDDAAKAMIQIAYFATPPKKEDVIVDSG